MFFLEQENADFALGERYVTILGTQPQVINALKTVFKNLTSDENGFAYESLSLSYDIGGGEDSYYNVCSAYLIILLNKVTVVQYRSRA